jgi:hypothetical protein
MTIARARRGLAFGSLIVPALLAGCRSKEPPPPPVTIQQAPPSTVPPTTTTTTVPSPPPVWRSAHWGMTKDEVLAAFPGEAQQLGQPADFGVPGAGSTDLAIPVSEIDGMKFRVLFGFESDALNRVHLSVVKAADTTCGDLEKLLTERYSAPSDRSHTQTNLRADQTVWKRPDQAITLTCAEAPGLGYHSVMLDYTVPSKN